MFLQIWQFTSSPILHLYENLQDSTAQTNSTQSSGNLQNTKILFENLFTRLNALADICGVDLWHKEKFTTTTRGRVTIDRDTWERINQALEKENTVGN